MRFIPIKTRKFLPPKDNIFELFDESLPQLREGDILIITSKVLGIHQGRSIPIEKDTRKEKINLARQEADWSVPEFKVAGLKYFLTIKDNTFVANAGIDKSNGDGYYLLWPKNTQKLLKEIWVKLRKKNKIKKLGIISIDSHMFPLRSGTVGVATGFYGFEPTFDYRGIKDIFGKPLEVTKTNIPDSLAATANYLMGEANEQTPFLIIRNAPLVKFKNQTSYGKWLIKPKDDVYHPLLKSFRKNRKKLDKRNRNR